jgi:hypothetical protein
LSDIEGDIMFAYKVVTQKLESLGLRKNPNILKYHISKWKFIHCFEVKRGKSDFGGIWVCKNISGANKLKKYMRDKYNQSVRIFKCKIGQVLYSNSYRIKTNAVYLSQEIK